MFRWIRDKLCWNLSCYYSIKFLYILLLFRFFWFYFDPISTNWQNVFSFFYVIPNIWNNYCRWCDALREIPRDHQGNQYCRCPGKIFHDFFIVWWLYTRVLLRILMFRVKMLLCKKPFGNPILMISTLKKDFFTFNKVFKKARNLFASLLSKVVSAHDTLAHWHEQKPL